MRNKLFIDFIVLFISLFFFNSDVNCQEKSISPISLITSGDNDIRGTGGLSSNLTGDMYRYQGAYTDTINNYICIGSDTCQTNVMTNDSYDDHTYRIIGIANDGRLKVIKMGRLVKGYYGNGTDLYWYWDEDYDDWTGTGGIRAGLNNTESGYYLDSLGDYASYIDSSTNSKFYSTATNGVSSPVYIPRDSWNSTSGSGDNQTATNLYVLETGGTITSYSGADYKVGLMQLSDYYLAVSDSANCSYSGGTYSTCGASWIHLSHNDTRYSYEWTAARISAGSAWIVYSDGSVLSDDLDNCYNYGVRPVLYLSSSIQLLGSGTKDSPYYIVEEETYSDQTTENKQTGYLYGIATVSVLGLGIYVYLKKYKGKNLFKNFNSQNSRKYN